MTLPPLARTAVLLLASTVLLRAADSVVVFNEIHYHPVDETSESEWVELHSLMGVNVDLSGWRLAGGIGFTFAEGTVIPGHGLLVVAANPSDPTLDGTGALGPFSGRLANSGETIRLVNNNGRIMDELSYGDDGDWPVAPDGLGATLAKRHEETAEARPFNWTASAQIGGTPGTPNFAPGEPFAPALVINELSAAGDVPFRVELANLTDTPLGLAGYELRSSSGVRHSLPEGTLDPGGYFVVTPQPAPVAGDRLALVRPGGTEIADAREVTDRLRGRSGDRWLYPSAPSFGAPNPFVFQSDIVINEIMYNPRVSPEAPQSDRDEQWIELFNKGTSEVDLGGWRFDDGVDFEFPPGTVMTPGTFLLVARDAASLLAKFPDLPVAGDWSGNLSRQGERLRLVDAHRNPADEVRYSDGGRWPSRADGGGSSLELRDPRADNNAPDAWAPSLESGPWQTISYSGRALNQPANDPTLYHEFIFGLLNAGEFLIDDLSVLEDPGGAARELIQNGDFSSGSAASWRLRGNHRHAEVVPDPDDPSNNVLHVRATGAMEHMHNHAETTLKAGGSFVTINANQTYQISFRAKWLGGSNQLNSRLYFNRLARTTLLDAPLAGGTPGAPNSRLVPNAGPTWTDLDHSPAVPAANEPATVSVTVSDPDGISGLALFHAVDGGDFAATLMDDESGGRFTGTIPGQPAGTKVQFYLAARDTRGATEFIPAGGPDSRALIPWNDGQANLDYGACQPNNFRIVMTAADTSFMHTVTEVMSNDRLGCTVIYNEREIYYDCGVRLKGSQRGRARDVRVGFLLGFPDDRPFLGAHETVAIDRSGAGDQFSQKEILVKHIVNHAGGIPGMHDDLIRVIAPRSAHTGSAMLLKSRFDDEWLENQFADGGDGTMFEYELIYYPTSTTGGPEGDKIPNPDSVVGVPMRSISGRRDKELYRYHWQIDNNKDADDYDGLIEMLAAMGLSGASYRQATDELLDVDQWLRAFAVQVLCGIGDNYATGAQHNALFYLPPSGGKAMYFPWDMDFSFNGSATAGLTPNDDLSRLIGASPANERAYYGHLLDIVNTTFNSRYLTAWARHYSCFLPAEDLNGHLNFIRSRESHALAAINSAVPRVPYRITTPDGATTDQPFVTIAGDGWVDLRELRLAGANAPLALTWTDDNSWRATVPVRPGSNTITIEALDFQGNLIGSESVEVIGTGSLVPASAANLAISEVMYRPAPPTIEEQNAGFSDADDFEFIELHNLSAAETLDLSGLAFADGISFAFPDTTLAPGERAIIAGNESAFLARYGSGASVLGSYQLGTSNRLANDGERLLLNDAAGLPIADFAYDDDAPWPVSADGDGYSLVLMNPGLSDPADPQSWRTSAALGGNPGSHDRIDLAAWMIAHGVTDLALDSDGDRIADLLEFVTGRDPNIPDGPPPVDVTLDQQDGPSVAVITIRQLIGTDEAVLSARASPNLLDWPTKTLFLGRTNNGDGTSTVRFGSPSASGASLEFLRIEANEITP